MKFYKKLVVPENFNGLLYKNKRVEQVLKAGVYRLWDFANEIELKLFAISGNQREINSEEILLLMDNRPELLTDLTQSWETGAEEIGLVYEQNVLKDIKLPNTRGAYWRGIREIRLEKINIAQTFKLSQREAALLLGATSEALRKVASLAIFAVTVPEGHVGFLEVDGQVTETLASGTHAWWKFSRVLKAKLLDTRLQNMEVNGQEILTKDKVSLRINLSATWQILDAERVRTQLADHNDFLYREMQLALRTVVSTQTLDQLLVDKNLLNQQVQENVALKALEYGIAVKTVGARDIVLPGEMKAILAQVVEAEKIAEANVIRRREETQATRSLHNTAKVMEGNPILLRLKELESLEKITGQIKSLNVFGGLNGVMNDMIRLSDSVKP